MDRAHLGEAAERLDELVTVEPLPCGRHQLDEHLAGVAALANDEVAQVAGLVCLVVRLEALRTRPVADRVANRVAELGRQPALLDLEHLIPAPRLVEAERGAGGGRGERILELVAVEELGLRRNDRLHRRVREPADPLQSVANLILLRLDLGLVSKILETAAAAGRVMGARRLDALGARLDNLDGERLGMAPLDLRDASAHRVAGESAPDEDDEAVQPRDAVAAVGERVDVELEFLILRNRRGHAGRLSRTGPHAWHEFGLETCP